MSAISEFLTADKVALCVGILGLVVGGYQTYSAYSAKRLYRNGCRIRCRDASDKAQRLADSIAQLCIIAHSDRLYAPIAGNASAGRAYAELHGQVGGALDVAKDWVRFCIRLNEEHQDEFNESALPPDQLQRLMEAKSCLVRLDDDNAAMSGTPRPAEVA